MYGIKKYLDNQQSLGLIMIFDQVNALEGLNVYPFTLVTQPCQSWGFFQVISASSNDEFYSELFGKMKDNPYAIIHPVDIRKNGVSQLGYDDAEYQSWELNFAGMWGSQHPLPPDLSALIAEVTGRIPLQLTQFYELFQDTAASTTPSGDVVTASTATQHGMESTLASGSGSTAGTLIETRIKSTVEKYISRTRGLLSVHHNKFIAKHSDRRQQQQHILQASFLAMTGIAPKHLPSIDIVKLLPDHWLMYPSPTFQSEKETAANVLAEGCFTLLPLTSVCKLVIAADLPQSPMSDSLLAFEIKSIFGSPACTNAVKETAVEIYILSEMTREKRLVLNIKKVPDVEDDHNNGDSDEDEDIEDSDYGTDCNKKRSQGVCAKPIQATAQTYHMPLLLPHCTCFYIITISAEIQRDLFKQKAKDT